MTSTSTAATILHHLDGPTRQLVRVAAASAALDETDLRRELAAAVDLVPALWMEELLLQTYLFAGFPRALNAMREWRRFAPTPEAAGDAVEPDRWRASGEATCATVYGGMYDRLRENIRALHPSLDEWMIVEGYGKILSRPALDLARRELCIVAACAASNQDRQLHSHLHGARNAGAADEAISATLDALAGLVEARRLHAARLLFARVVGK